MGMLDSDFFPQNTGTAGNAALGLRSFLNLLGGRVYTPNELYQQDQFAGAMDNAKLNYLQQQGEAYRMNNLESLQKLDQQRAAIEQAHRQQMQQQQYLSSLRQPSPGVSPDMALVHGAQSGDIGPTISNQQRIAAPDPGRQFNPLEALQNGFDLKSAQELAGMNNWGRAKVSHFQDTRGPNGVQVTGFNEYGDAVQTGQTPFKAPEKLDLGGSVQLYDPITGEVNGRFGKSMTPGEAASNAVAWANYGLNKQNANKSQLVQTDQGFVWADPRSHQIVPAMGQDGMPIQPKLKDLPPAMQKTVMENTNSLRKIDRALELVDKYPNAFGLSNVLGDTVRQRTDAEGVDGRAAVADIGSLVIHDRSGAAVTAAEYPRLAPFVPKATDSPETVKKKLQRFKSEYESVLSDVSSMYSKENGYRVPKMPEAPSNQQQLSRADREASVKNARNAILRNPSQKAAIIQRLEQNGITNHGLR